MAVVSEKLLKFLLGELKTIRVHCQTRLPIASSGSGTCPRASRCAPFPSIRASCSPSLSPGMAVPSQPWTRIRSSSGKQRLARNAADFRTAANAVAFLADGRTLAAGCADGTVRLCDVPTGQEIGQFKGHQGAVTGLAFSPDGKALVSVGADTTALIWSMTYLARPKAGPAPALDAKAQETHWSDLAGPDAKAACKAIQTLSAAPAAAAVLVGKRLRPVEPIASERLKQLLADLRSNQFTRREKAAGELARSADLAEPAMRHELAAQPPLEVRQRVEKLLERLVVDPLSPTDLQAVRAVEILEQTGSAEARQLLEELAKDARQPGKPARPTPHFNDWPGRPPCHEAIGCSDPSSGIRQRRSRSALPVRAHPGDKRRSDLTRGCWSLRPSQKTATHSANRLPSSRHAACVPSSRGSRAVIAP